MHTSLQKAKYLVKSIGVSLPLTGLIWTGPFTALAQGVGTCNNLITTLNRIANFGGGILLTIAVLVLLTGAYYLLFGGGSEEAAKKGKQYLIYGVTGIVVGLLAFSLPNLVANILNINLASCPF